jgi:exocyst complex component 4
LGRDEELFYNVADQLEVVVENIVSNHHRDLNATIDAYSGTLDGITGGQRRIAEIRERLEQSRDNLRLKRAELVQVFIRRRQYQEMMTMLEEIDKMSKVPVEVNALKKKKAYPDAVTLLQRASKKVMDRQYVDIGALAELRRYIAHQLATIHESMINDLHAHLYKKKAVKRIKERNKDEDDADDEDEDEMGDEMQEKFYRWQPDTTKAKDELEEDSDLEANSSGFMDLLLGCLSRLQKMQEALEMIQQRTSGEIRRLTDGVYAESERKGHEPAQFLRPLYGRFIKVLDMYWLMYDKIAMVLELEEPAVARRIEEVNNQTFKEVWLSVQNEIKSVFYDYLTEDQRSPAAFANPINNLNDFLKDKKKIRDRKKAWGSL